jgi:uncharacterized membrane protein
VLSRAPTVAVAVLLALAVAGLQASGPFSRATQPEAAGLTGTALVASLSVAEGIAFIAFLVLLASARPRRPPKDQDEPPRIRIPWWVKVLGVVAGTFAVATPLAILLARHARRASPAPFLVHPGAPAAGGSSHTTVHSSGWSLVVGMVLAIALVVVVAVRSRRPARRRPGARPGTLNDSLAAARAALAAGATPREAIIACYTAMERGLAAAGSAPDAADTPAEVLTRATSSGIPRSAAAEALTGLFRRARYSDEPMTAADSAAAADALARMRAELADRP